MELYDRLTIDASRRTSDGSLVANVRAARSGIQVYAGFECGKPEMDTVRVFRPEEEVFAKDSLATYACRPVTNDHPPEQVTVDNWRQYAVGSTGEDVARDGEFIRVPMMLCDAAAIADVQAGKRQLSLGYTCDLAFEPGEHNGEAYDAVQRNIRANHLAVVRTARGGPDLRIDHQPRPAAPQQGALAMADTALKTVTVDGIDVQMTDTAAAVVEKRIKALTDALADAKTVADTVPELQKQVETKDGEIKALKQQLDDATKPEAIDQAVKDRAAVIAGAKAILGDAFDPASKADADIRRAVVAKKLGDDAAKAMTDDAITGAFSALTAGTLKRDAAAEAFSHQQPNTADARDTAHAAYRQSVGDAWKPKAAA